MAHALLAVAQPVAFAKTGVVLAFSPSELGVAEPRRPEIEKLLAEAFGSQVSLTMTGSNGQSAPAPSLDETNRRRAEEERERRRSEARGHPATRATLEVFRGAEIKDVKVEE